MKYSTLFLCAVLFFGTNLNSKSDPSDPNLSDEEREEIIQDQESRWDFRPAKEGRKSQKSEKENLPVYEKTISPQKDNRFALGPLFIVIPAGSFSTRRNVEVKANVLTKHVDFLFAGIPTQIDGKNPILFESVGMFQILFRDDEGRSIRPVKDVSVGMNSLENPERARVYSLQSGTWQETAKSQMQQGVAEAASGVDGQYLPFIYTNIPWEGWWNFDKPNKEFTCVKGEIAMSSGAEYKASSVGVDYFGMNSVAVQKNGRFRLNVVKNRKVKVFIAEDSDNKSDSRSFELGTLPIFLSQKKTAFAADEKSDCQDLGKIGTKSFPKSLSSDRKEFLKAIDMPDI